MIPHNVITMPQVPDELLVNCLVKLGYPRRIAGRFLDSFQLRVETTILYYDVIDAEMGDIDAKNRVEHIRHQADEMRRAEKALGNDPDIGPRVPVVGRVGMPENVSAPRGPRIFGMVTPSKAELKRISERGKKPVIHLPGG